MKPTPKPLPFCGALYLLVAALFLLAAPAVLARFAYDWCRSHWPRRVLAALVLLFYTPRPVDGPLFTFCFPE